MWTWVAVLAPSVLFFLAAGRREAGFARQPWIVLALTPRRFAEAVERAGGQPSVRRGLWLDLVFIVMFALPATLLLRSAGGSWGVPIATAAVDLLENLMIGLLMKRGVSSPATAALAVVGVAKFVLYGLTIWQLVRSAP